MKHNWIFAHSMFCDIIWWYRRIQIFDITWSKITMKYLFIEFTDFFLISNIGIWIAACINHVWREKSKQTAEWELTKNLKIHSVYDQMIMRISSHNNQSVFNYTSCPTFSSISLRTSPSMNCWIIRFLISIIVCIAHNYSLAHSNYVCYFFFCILDPITKMILAMKRETIFQAYVC